MLSQSSKLPSPKQISSFFWFTDLEVENAKKELELLIKEWEEEDQKPKYIETLIKVSDVYYDQKSRKSFLPLQSTLFNTYFLRLCRGRKGIDERKVYKMDITSIRFRFPKLPGTVHQSCLYDYGRVMQEKYTHVTVHQILQKSSKNTVLVQGPKPSHVHPEVAPRKKLHTETVESHPIMSNLFTSKKIGLWRPWGPRTE
jgi:hypothetical protein